MKEGLPTFGVMESSMSYHDLRFDEGEGLNRQGLADRIVAGEVFVFREALQAFDCYDMLEEASLKA